jgi:hypothetical protein
VSQAPLRRLRLATAIAGLLALAIAGSVQAHVLKDFGSYSVALGWAHEPTYVGQVNAIQVVVKDKSGKAVTDLADGDLKVVVSIGGQTSDALPLLNKYDPDTGLGIAGDYEASLTPTVPGDYTFHLTGSIHGQAVDELATSSDSTFNSAVEATGIQFPSKLPSLSEITTRLDRIDTRLAASPSPAAAAPAASADPMMGLADAVTAAQTTASAAGSAAAQARDAASTALMVGSVLAIVGILLGASALWMTFRSRRRA